MLLEIFAAIVVFALALIYLAGEHGDKPLAIAAGIILILLGIFIGIEGISTATGTPYLLNTTEDSRYWDCVILNVSCEGEVTPYPATNACWEYTYAQCISIPGCNWTYSGQDYYCNGTPTVTCNWLGTYDPTGNKCFETKGCQWYRNETNGTCDWVFTNYQYSNQTSLQETRNDELIWAVCAVCMLIGVYLIIASALAKSSRPEIDEDAEDDGLETEEE